MRRLPLCILLLFLALAEAPAAVAQVTYVVTNTDATGPGSLAQAIEDANESPGTNSIVFEIAGDAPHVISLTSPLPVITGTVTVDGLSQNGDTCSSGPIDLPIVIDGGSARNVGAALDFNGAGESTVRGLEIRNIRSNEIDGGNGIRFINSNQNVVECVSSHGNSGYGIRIDESARNRIGGSTASARNHSSNNRFAGIGIFGIESVGNEVSGNYIGTDATGNAASGNEFVGVYIENAGETLIGGPDEGAGNIIAGNLRGGMNVLTLVPGVGATNIVNNYIGIGADGATAIPNGGDGMRLIAGSNFLVEGNVISGNTANGIWISGIAASKREKGDAAAKVEEEGGYHQILNNIIGLDASAEQALPNGQSGIHIRFSPGSLIRDNIVAANAMMGVYIQDAESIDNHVDGNFIGTNRAGAALGNSSYGILALNSGPQTIGGAAEGDDCVGNTIAYNGAAGVAIIAGGNASIRKVIRCNRIFLNDGLGIDLSGDGPTENDPGDADGADRPNQLQNFPTLASTVAVGDSLEVVFAVDSDPDLETEGSSTYPLSIELFLADVDTEYPQGRTPLGWVHYTRDDYSRCGLPPCEKTARFRVREGRVLGEGAFLVATATDAEGNTSEFSRPAATLETVVSTEASPERRGFSLSAYPNPANAGARIELSLPEITEVRIELFDVLGRRVATLHDGLLTAGTQRLTLDTSALPAGAYLIRAIRPDGKTSVSRITVAR